MDQWGPYLYEKVGSSAITDGSLAEDSGGGGGGGGVEDGEGGTAAVADFCNRDGIFGFCNSGGTAGSAIAVWTGGGEQPKARLQHHRLDDEVSVSGGNGGVSCEFLPGLIDPLYRYCACRCRCKQTSGPEFDIRFELAKEQPNRLYYRLTVETRIEEPASATAATELTVAVQLWVCHPDCGRIQLVDESEADGGGVRCVKLRMADGCRSQACVQLLDRLESGNTDLLSDESRQMENLKLHCPSEQLDSVVFCADPLALERLIAHQDASLLCSDQTSGCRVAFIYRLRLPPASSCGRSLSFLLASAEDPGPDSAVWISELMSRASALAAAALTPPTELEQELGAVIRRALCGLLWNRQLCCLEPHSESSAATSTSATAIGPSLTVAATTSLPFLTVVPDKWRRPGLGGWEHGLHAIALCRVSRDLALSELRNHLVRMSACGEILTAPDGGTEPPVWPLALLEFLRYHDDPDAANVTFCDLLRHLHWWLLMRRDASNRSTLDGGVLGLRHAGWMDAVKHDGVSNDSLVWSGFFCAKMVHLAAVLRRQELKSLLDLFNAAMASLHNEAAFVDGLFRPNMITKTESTSAPGGGNLPAGASPPCRRAAPCCCVFGLVPLLGCAIVPWDALEADGDAQTLVNWLHWLANEASSHSDTPCLFLRGEDTHNQMLISWLGEAEFLRTCQVLFDPRHFLGPHGLRCTSRLLSQEANDDESDVKDSRCRPTRSASIVSLPWNYLVLEALKCWESAYGQQLQLDYPTGAGVRCCLNDIIVDISKRLMSIFTKFDDDTPILREYYEATSGRGVGGHRTAWSSIIANIAENLTRQPTLAVHTAPPIPRAVGHILPRNSVVHEFRETLRSSIKLEEFAPDTSFDWDDDEI